MTFFRSYFPLSAVSYLRLIKIASNKDAAAIGAKFSCTRRGFWDYGLFLNP